MSSYAQMDHADWMQRHIDSCKRQKIRMQPTTPQTLNDFQKRVVNIIGIVGGGIYNAPINHNKIIWDYGQGVSVVWQREMSTWDFQQLSMLVFLCHEARIRCQIEGCGPRNMRLTFWERKKEGDIAVRHPNLDEAVNEFRKWFKSDNPIHYGGQ